MNFVHLHPRRLRLGYVAVADAAPVVMARELDLFRSHGLDVELSREVGWATIRDKVVYGELDAAQAPGGLLADANLGIGSARGECLTALVLNLNGNAITLSERLWREGVRDGSTLARHLRKSQHPLTLGVVHRFASHHILLRKWLGEHQITGAARVRIISLPPKQAVRNLKAGHLDGFCVGEPWGSLAICEEMGWCAATSADISPRHPEKVLMVRKQFAIEFPEAHSKLIAALLEACRFCSEPSNQAHVAEVLARPGHVGAPAHMLGAGFSPSFHYGHGIHRGNTPLHVFHGNGVNEPTQQHGQWFLKGLRTTDVLPPQSTPPSADARDWFRADLYRTAKATANTANP